MGGLTSGYNEFGGLNPIVTCHQDRTEKGISKHVDDPGGSWKRGIGTCDQSDCTGSSKKHNLPDRPLVKHYRTSLVFTDSFDDMCRVVEVHQPSYF